MFFRLKKDDMYNLKYDYVLIIYVATILDNKNNNIYNFSKKKEVILPCLLNLL